MERLLKEEPSFLPWGHSGPGEENSQVLREALAVGHSSASHGSLVAGPCLLMSDLA